jgi:hypothetical protein
MSRRIYKRVGRAEEEEVVLQDLLRLAQLLLCLLKVKVDVQRLDEVGDGVIVLVAFLANDADQVLELLLVLVRVAALIPVCDDGGDEVAQDPRAVCLDGVDEGGRVEHLSEGLARGLVVEEREERPVDQPCAVLQLCEGVVEEARVDELFKLVDLLDSRVPVYGQNFAGEFAPGGRALFVAVGGLSRQHFLLDSSSQTYQHAEAVEQLSGMRVDATAVLELAKLVQLVHHLDRHAVRVLEVGQVLHLVAAQVSHDALVVQQARDFARLGLELVAPLQDLVALLLVLVGHVGQAVDLLVQLAHKVRHVGRLEQLQQQPLLLDRLLGIVISDEVDQRVDEVPVEVRHELGQEAVLLGDVAARRGVGHDVSGRRRVCIWLDSRGSAVVLARIWCWRRRWWGSRASRKNDCA